VKTLEREGINLRAAWTIISGTIGDLACNDNFVLIKPFPSRCLLTAAVLVKLGMRHHHGIKIHALVVLSLCPGRAVL